VKTNRNNTGASIDKADLDTLMVTLNASPSCLRRDDAGL
jgi:hypothetical protein